jgi:DNA-binding NarL/FixJ family response regulator
MSSTAGDGRPIRVVIVDDHPMFLDGVRADLQRSGIAMIIGEASSGGQAIDVVRDSKPDVVLMDLGLPDMPGSAAIRTIVDGSPQVKILVLSMSADEADVLDAVKAGACGYLLKTSTADELIEGIERAYEGDAVFTPALAGLVLTEFRRTSAVEQGDPALTARENEILRLVAQGHSYGEIGQQLYISPKTVRNHVQNILRKLQLGKRYELMRYAIERGLDTDPARPPGEPTTST